jgi:SP family general alpha glucoside:H+ symporter-like MFS transporter
VADLDPQNCVVWAAQILCGNAILGYAVVFLQKAGFGVTASFNLNLITNCQYIVGGVACWNEHTNESGHV